MSAKFLLVLLLHQLLSRCSGSEVSDVVVWHANLFSISGSRLDASLVLGRVRSRSFLSCCILCHEAEGCRGVAHTDGECWLLAGGRSCSTGESRDTCHYKVAMLRQRSANLEIPANGKDCKELLERGHTNDGVYSINPPGTAPFQAFCDMRDGGWTVIQRRVDDSVDFNRGWKDYVAGFGDACGNFWAGLDNMHAITSCPSTELLVTMETFEGESADAHYSAFQVGDAASGYILTVGGYSGTAEDAMTSHNLQRFSTYDNDHDAGLRQNCAELFGGGWWYNFCHKTNPNGLYLHGATNSYAEGVVWLPFKGRYSLKGIQFEVRAAC